MTTTPDLPSAAAIAKALYEWIETMPDGPIKRAYAEGFENRARELDAARPASAGDIQRWDWSWRTHGAALLAGEGVIPEGFVLVPREPTEEMVCAALEAGEESYRRGDSESPDYEAAIRAAIGVTPTAADGREAEAAPVADGAERDGHVLHHLDDEKSKSVVIWTGERRPTKGSHVYLTHPHAASAKDAQDAARYRWLRERVAVDDHGPLIPLGRSNAGRDLTLTDAAIDAAMGAGQ